MRIAFVAMAMAWSLSAQAANRPDGYVTLCAEGKTCSVSASTKVAFGRADKFFYKQLTGSFVCNEATFGGRVAGGTNECSAPKRTSSSSSSSSSGSSLPPGTPPASITGGTCVSTGTIRTADTIVVSSGVFDGGCKTYIYTGEGDQGDLSMTPVFRLNSGTTLKNVIIGAPGAAGVYIYGNATVDNVTWADVGDTGITVKSSGTATIKNITATKGADRFLQVNAVSTVKLQNCILDTIGATAVRQNGGTTYKIDVTLDSCRIAGPATALFRTDSSVSTARLLNSYVRMTGTLCLGPWASCSISNSFSY
ncbi:MAG: pectate lyase [Rhodocyclaceae bacterium]